MMVKIKLTFWTVSKTSQHLFFSLQILNQQNQDLLSRTMK